jgi:GNAT superfamily N-acetyltransferase
MQFIDVDPDDPRLASDIFPVLLELRTHLTPVSLKEIYTEGHTQGLRFTAAYIDGACAGVAGWRIMATTLFGRKLYVDDLVTRFAVRSQGAGKALLAELERRARASDCLALDLDSGTQRTDAHRFYTREHMSIVAFHFEKDLSARRPVLGA